MVAAGRGTPPHTRFGQPAMLQTTLLTVSNAPKILLSVVWSQHAFHLSVNSGVQIFAHLSAQVHQPLAIRAFLDTAAQTEKIKKLTNQLCRNLRR